MRPGPTAALLHGRRGGARAGPRRRQRWRRRWRGAAWPRAAKFIPARSVCFGWTVANGIHKGVHKRLDRPRRVSPVEEEEEFALSSAFVRAWRRGAVSTPPLRRITCGSVQDGDHLQLRTRAVVTRGSAQGPVRSRRGERAPGSARRARAASRSSPAPRPHPGGARPFRTLSISSAANHDGDVRRRRTGSPKWFFLVGRVRWCSRSQT
jgi:hypothetical protein